jgi:Spy/CpxP family protein refolding chaperone
MHPAMIEWWNERRRAHHGCGDEAHFGHGPFGGRHRGHRHGPEGFGDAVENLRGAWAAHGDDEFGGFGVRRPLRFLVHKLELEEDQVSELARILNELKTERAQAAVDNRRVVAGFADAMAGEAFDEAKTTEVAAERVKSAERLKDALVKAMKSIHAILDAEQRAKFAYLVRTGVLSL